MRLVDIVSIHGSQRTMAEIHAAFVAHQEISKEANQKLQAELEKFDSQQVSRKTFLRRTKKILSNAYKRAYLQGSGLTKLTSDGRRWIESFSEKQFEYLDNFAAAIEAGEGMMEYDSRMEMYSKSIKAAYWGGTAIESSYFMNWITTAGESCEDCLNNEAGNPYHPDELPGVPGDGSTKCKSNCKCYLVRAK